MRVTLVLIVALALASCGPRAAGPRDALSAIEFADLSRSVAAPSASGAQFFVAPKSLHAGPMIAVPERELVIDEPDVPAEFTEVRTIVTVHPMPDEIDAADALTPTSQTAATQPDFAAAPLDVSRPDITPESGRLTQALSSAYQTNPVVNRARANLRAADEEVAIARSTIRPTVSLAASGGLETRRNVNVPVSRGARTFTDDERSASVALEVTQPLFRGFRTRNSTRAAAAGVRAERKRLRATEQDVILATANAFLDVRRARRGEALRRQEVAFLQQQIAAAESRLRFGEATRTDVDQATTRLGEAQALLFAESAAARAAEARFREFSNTDPGTLNLDIDLAALVPSSLADALRAGQNGNPDIQLALHEVDAANFEVQTLAGERLPTVSVTGRVGLDAGTITADRSELAAVRLNVSMPIYQGGGVSARVRQAKELLGGARIDVDVARNETRSDIASAWGAYQGAVLSLEVADASIAVAQRAVSGLLEELRVGERTTVDVLDAQRDLIRVQITRAGALRQRDAAAFQLLRELGQLDPSMLGLGIPAYDPKEHYVAVKDRWAGLRTPNGS